MAKLSNQLRALFTWIVQPMPFLAVLCSALLLFFLVKSVDIVGPNIPLIDDWAVNVPIAIHAREGTLTFGEIVAQYAAQRPVFTRLLTAVVSYTTDWNLRTERDICIVLNGVCLILLVDLVRLRQRQMVPLMLVLFSALFFSLRQWYTMVLVTTTHTHIVNAFFVLALWMLARFHIGWKALAGAAVFSLCATFSYGIGMVAWPVLALTMYMLGYCKWRFYAFWTAAAMVSLALFFTGYKLPASRPLVGRFLRFFWTGLGNPVSTTIAGAREMAVVGLLLLGVNGYVIWRRRHDWSEVAVWAALAAYSMASMVIIAAGRATYRYPMQRAMDPKYTATITPLWVAAVATAVIAMWQVLGDSRRHRVKMLLVRGNAVFLVVLAGQYLDIFGSRWQPQPLVSTSDVRCYQAFPLTRNSGCLGPAGSRYIQLEYSVIGKGESLIEPIGKLALYRKTAFAQAVAVLPADSQAGDRVVIDAPLAYQQHYSIAYRGPGGKQVEVPNDDQFHILRADQGATLKSLREQPAHLALDADQAALAQFEAFVNGAERVWYLRTVDPAPFGDVFLDALSAHYAQYYVQVEDELLYPSIVEFRRLPDGMTLSEQFRFDEALSLQGWQLPGGVQVEACQNVTLDSWWSVPSAVDTPYVMALVMSDMSGMGVTRVQQPPASYETPQLVPGHLYLDVRTLSIPCDVEAGDYPLLVMLYRLSSDYSTVTPVIATGPDGAPVGEYVYLTTLTIK
jgi:hypothetical protein